MNVSDAQDAVPAKVSQSLAERLPSLGPTELARVILLLGAPTEGRSPSGRRNGQRADNVESIRAAARPALTSIDEALATHGGRRLSEDIDALGTVSVDATPAAVSALSSLSGVRAVLDDQPLRGVKAR